MQYKHYINLTNGIEHIPDFIEDVPFSFIRIQSTTIENKDYIKLFYELDYDLLMNLAIGNTCKIYDASAHNNLSKIVYTGLPLIVWILTKRWYGITLPETNSTRSGIIRKLPEGSYQKIYAWLFFHNQTAEKNKVKLKIDYFKRFLIGNKVNLLGDSFHTEHDNDWEFYKDIIIKKYKL